MKATSTFGCALLCVAWCIPSSAHAQEKKAFPPPRVARLALSPDGKTLALAESIRNIRLWDVGDQKDRRVIPIGGLWGVFSSIAFATDGKSLAVAGVDRLERWNLETEQLQKTFRNPIIWAAPGAKPRTYQPAGSNVVPDWFTCAVFTKDGKRLFSASEEYGIQVWDANTGLEIAKLLPYGSPAPQLALSGDGKVLASSGIHEIRIWDTERQRQLTSFDNLGPIGGLAMSADGKKFLSARGEFVLLWDLSRNEPLKDYKGPTTSVTHVAFSPNEKLVLASARNTIWVWNANSFELLATLEIGYAGAGFAITHDSRRLISCDYKGTVMVQDLPNVR
jgi:WD40 repeat protein